MVKRLPSKEKSRVRFPLPAPYFYMPEMSKIERPFIEEEVKKDSKILNDIRLRLKKMFKEEKIFNQERFSKLKKDLEQTYPEYKEEINIFFEMRGIFLAQLDLKYQKLENIKSKEYKEKFAELTKFNARFINFIFQNKDREDYMEMFWAKYFEIGELYGFYTDELKMLKSGLIAQASIMQIMEQLKYKIRMATPEEDAYQKIDLWISRLDEQKEIALQVKSKAMGGKSVKPRVRLSKFIRYPTIEASKEADENVISVSAAQYEGPTESLMSYQKRTGHKVIALDIFLPMNKEFILNTITGKPTDRCIDFIKRRLDFLLPNLENNQ